MFLSITVSAAGDVELELPEGTPDFNPDMNRIRPSAGEPDQDTWLSTSRRTTLEGALPTVHESVLDGRLSNGSIKLDNLPAEQLAAAQQQQQLGLQVRQPLLTLMTLKKDNDFDMEAIEAASACEVQMKVLVPLLDRAQSS